MKAIRRSLKNDKEKQHAQHPSVSAKNLYALPPKKVIKALYDYVPENKSGHELAFHKGDFFHVLSREDDTEWYEACNPLVPSARGLVPVAFFEVIGKQQRQSGQSVGSAHDRQEGHDSGFSEKGMPGIAHARSESNVTTLPAHHNRGPSMAGRKQSAMVYGVVQYDFNAERADELEARAGEAVIVVAQSDPEWFVAKPIGRLGGPGLIPVSFVDIKDTATMQTVTDPLEAVRKAGVPRVEEWKKFTAEYKNSSITLGKFDPPPAQLTAGMARMNMNSQSPNSSTSAFSQVPTPNQQPPTMMQDGSIPLAPISASVPRYCFDNDMYWYIIECQMEDGRWWELSRYYADFYDLQIALLESFPEEAGNKGKMRTLPFMPGPVAHVTDAISNGRRQNLDEYIRKIVSMPPHISKCMLVRNLFKPKPGQDFEIDPNALGEDYRLSGQSQFSTLPTQSNPRQSGGPPPPSSAYGAVPSPTMHPSAQQRPPGNPGGHAYAESSVSHQGPSTLSNGRPPQPGGALKIKVFFQDDIIAIRVPHDISFQALKDKLIDRLKVNEDILIQFKDEPSNSFVDLEDDDNLDVAIQRNPKLALYVTYAAD